MSRVRVENFMVSVDGFAAGLNQTLKNPFGEGGMELPKSFLATKTFKTMIGKDGGSTGIDNQFASTGFDNIGASVMGRNMFGPQRGEWTDESWKGWWGPNPPYHTPVFVMTHYPRPSLVMEGGTVFEFVSDDLAAVVAKAKTAAQGKDVRLNGGVQTVRNGLLAGLVDHLHLAISPLVMGKGENLLAGIDLAKLGYSCVETKAGEGALHLVYQKLK
ncbi:dihydrofolate reductase family protein [Aestuariivirga litoralis]|uniref:dihydrofolate reductase family protein n=1 Tax=Aestuariivirga litoralis TaxID=2650924 RepID=UPI0018C4EB90|nr:dihydrofolate reductase family protein [Aestuariivirga litoralis]MBG1233088.1 dihydrofolate reductase [Aestuariivirga litoralis]